MLSLTIYLCVLLLIALSIVFFALRKSKVARWVLPIIFSFFACLMYYQWGSYSDLKALENRMIQRRQVEKALKEYEGPEAIIARMEQHLIHKPDSVKGWFLLGKLYFSQKMIIKANDAFAKAYELDKNSLEIKLQYMESSYIINNQNMTGKAKKLLNEILKQWPDQLDALNFAAIDAYSHKKYSLASSYWQKMLIVLPDGSKEKRAVLDAIANAQLKQGKSKNDTR